MPWDALEVGKEGPVERLCLMGHLRENEALMSFEGSGLRAMCNDERRRRIRFTASPTPPLPPKCVRGARLDRSLRRGVAAAYPKNRTRPVAPGSVRIPACPSGELQ